LFINTPLTPLKRGSVACPACRWWWAPITAGNMYIGIMQLIKPRQISGEIMTLIEEADKKVILVTPYFRVKNWYKLLNTFNNLKNRTIDVEMFVREGEHESISEAREAGFKPITIPHLHTKLYLNEKIGIVSSMNLLYSSDTNSLDIALKTETQKEYDELLEYYRRYISRAPAKTQPVPTPYNGQIELTNALTNLLGYRVSVEEQSDKLLIQTGNRYEAFIRKNNGSELRVNGILSTKEFEHAIQCPDKVSVKGMSIEYLWGGNGNYDTVWGSYRNLKTNKITEPLENESRNIINLIVGFIGSVEHFKQNYWRER
jgi:hypothetical protein